MKTLLIKLKKIFSARQFWIIVFTILLISLFIYQKKILTSTPKHPYIQMKFNRNTFVDSMEIYVDYVENKNYDYISIKGKLIFDNIYKDSFSDLEITSNLKASTIWLNKDNPNVKIKEIDIIKYKDGRKSYPGYSFKFPKKENWFEIIFYGSIFEKDCSDIISEIGIIPFGGIINFHEYKNWKYSIANTRNINFFHIYPNPDYQDAFHLRFEKQETIDHIFCNGVQVQGEDTNRKNKNQFISLVISVIIGALFSGVISLIIDLLIRKDKMKAPETAKANPESLV